MPRTLLSSARGETQYGKRHRVVEEQLNWGAWPNPVFQQLVSIRTVHRAAHSFFAFGHWRTYRAPTNATLPLALLPAPTLLTLLASLSLQRRTQRLMRPRCSGSLYYLVHYQLRPMAVPLSGLR